MNDLVVIGGPNGAGKTTAAKVAIPQNLGITEFVNADEIARGLSPFAPDSAAVAAARLMLVRMRLLAQGKRSFAIESTCSGKGHIKFIRRCKLEGWRVTLVFLWLSSPQIAIERVAKRVADGGHTIDEATIIRRYWAGLRNLPAHYLPLADVAAIYDNGGDSPILVAQRTPEVELIVFDGARWEAIERAAQWQN
jgi:predicted ABC-type ATPase